MGSPGTGAFVGIDQVNAGAPVLAGLGGALIDLLGAVGPHVSRQALKEERRNKKEEDGARRRERKKRRRKKKRGGGKRRING